jgi:trimeric autotransporter adhesin
MRTIPFRIFSALAWTVMLTAFPPAIPATTVPGDQHWDNQFGATGLSDPALAMTATASTVYAGGLFTSAGNANAAGIAGFDGTNWSGLGNGIVGQSSLAYVWSLNTDGTNVYAGGSYTNMDNSGASYIAQWDGTRWHPMGTNSLNGYVLAITGPATNLYAAGTVFNYNGSNINSIVHWNGTGWTPVGTGVTGGTIPGSPFINVMLMQGGNLYVGGSFTNAGGVSASSIAMWDGGAWHALGPGLGGQVLALVSYGGYIYAGGGFTNTGLGITNLAKWDGANWTAVGLGTDQAVRDLETNSGNLYAGGSFTRIDTISAGRIAVWNGSAWSPLGNGTLPPTLGSLGAGVYKMVWRGNRMYVAGNFGQVGTVAASHVAGWDGTNWFALGGTTSKGMSHLIGNVRSFSALGGNIYACGAFTSAGQATATNVAKWDGTNWSLLGIGLAGATAFTSQAEASATVNGLLYVGGSFVTAGGVSANDIASWNGTSWSGLSTGVNSNVQALLGKGTDLYVGGFFTSAGGVAVHEIARWDGNAWNDVGSGVSGGSAFVNALATDGTYVYVGGNFTTVGVVNSAANIARWDGANWAALGTGVNSTVDAIATGPGGVLYVGGGFTTAGGGSANRIAMWNGTTWTALGAGLNSTVQAIAVGTNGAVYAGGNFTNAAGTTAYGIAKWDGTNWMSLGSGLTNSQNGAGIVQALFVTNNDLYVGGNCVAAGGKPSFYIAHWNDQSNYYPTPHLQLTNFTLLPGKQARFRIAGTSGEQYIIRGTTDLTTWTNLQTNSAVLFDYLDTAAPGFSKRFYDAVLNQ